MSCIVTFGPVGSEITLSDLTRYAIPPNGFHKEYKRREIFRERRAGGSDLSYSRIVQVTMREQLLFYPDPVSGYDGALANFNAVHDMFKTARDYWRTLKDNPNPNPPVYYNEQFLNQGGLAAVTKYLVQTGDCTEGERLWLPSGGIIAEILLICDAPTTEDILT